MLDISKYKGCLIKDISREEFKPFRHANKTIIEDPILVLATTQKVPENINNQWQMFFYSVGDNDHKDYFYGCGMRLPVTKEMEGLVAVIADGTFDPDDNFIVYENGSTSLADNKENYARYLKAQALSWDQTKHNYVSDAYPIDATPKNIKVLSELSLDPLKIDPTQVCNLGLFIIRTEN